MAFTHLSDRQWELIPERSDQKIHRHVRLSFFDRKLYGKRHVIEN